MAAFKLPRVTKYNNLRLSPVAGMTHIEDAEFCLKGRQRGYNRSRGKATVVLERESEDDIMSRLADNYSSVTGEYRHLDMANCSREKIYTISQFHNPRSLAVDLRFDGRTNGFVERVINLYISIYDAIYGCVY
jgi:hypothetical protein